METEMYSMFKGEGIYPAERCVQINLLELLIFIGGGRFLISYVDHYGAYEVNVCFKLKIL